LVCSSYKFSSSGPTAKLAFQKIFSLVPISLVLVIFIYNLDGLNIFQKQNPCLDSIIFFQLSPGPILDSLWKWKLLKCTFMLIYSDMRVEVNERWGWKYKEMHHTTQFHSLCVPNTSTTVRQELYNIIYNIEWHGWQLAWSAKDYFVSMTAWLNCFWFSSIVQFVQSCITYHTHLLHY